SRGARCARRGRSPRVASRHSRAGRGSVGDVAGLGTLMAADLHIRQIGDGVYRVEIDGRAETVYVAGTPRDRWVYWDGRLVHGDFQLPVAEGRIRRPPARQTRSLTAPMPATVIKVQVKPGDTVKKG